MVTHHPKDGHPTGRKDTTDSEFGTYLDSAHKTKTRWELPWMFNYHPLDGHPPTQGWSPTRRKYTTNSINYCHTRLHLGFSAKLRVWQVPACKMEPRSGIIFAPYAISPCSTRPDPTTRRVSLKMLLEHVWRLCGVPILVWTPDHVTNAMNGHPPSLGWSPPTQGWSPIRRKYTTASKFGT